MKTIINLTISDDYSLPLQREDLEVTLISQSDPAKTKRINVIKVDPDNKIITLKYGGAYSGIYKVEVYSKRYGLFDTSNITFEAIGEVTSIYPNSGSLYGGTVITITGHTFSDDPTDNPVNIGTTPCDVITSSPT